MLKKLAILAAGGLLMLPIVLPELLEKLWQRPTAAPAVESNQKIVCGTGPAVAIEEAKQINLQKFKSELDRIKKELGITIIYQGFPGNSSAADWKAYLDAAEEAETKLIATFADNPPKTAGSGIDLGITGRFLAEMKDHPALYAIFLIDEPFHQKHGWKITADKLKQMYGQAKKLAPKVPVIAQFSREIQKMETDGKIQYQFGAGMCDVCQISALEFRNYGQGNKFYKEDLIKNHSVSRRVIGRETPAAAIYSSAQSFGNKLGKSSYYFPSLEEYQEMLRLLMSDELAKSGKLSGIYFQTWTAETIAVSGQQQNLSSPESAGHRKMIKGFCEG